MELSALQSMVAMQEEELQVQAADMESLTRSVQIKEDLIKVSTRRASTNSVWMPLSPWPVSPPLIHCWFESLDVAVLSLTCIKELRRFHKDHVITSLPT